VETDAGIAALVVGVVTAVLTFAARSRTVSNDEWRNFIDELQADRDQWRKRALECEAAR